MPRKSNPAVRKQKQPSTAMPYPSLAEGKTPQQRLEELLAEADARGIKPVDEAVLLAMGEVWPDEENLDEFLTWLRQSRRSGRYD